MIDEFLNYQLLRQSLEEAYTQYEETAPALAGWLDDLFMALSEKPMTVTLFELLQFQQLRRNGEWEQPDNAQDRWSNVLDALGKDHSFPE